ncbi:MAG TPA: ABC transporter permease [Bryobacterales bacterium]|nr:ABC transporter permease [Bryobacterales bacterium]
MSGQHQRLFPRLVWRAMIERRQRVALALAALTVAATLSTALLGLYSDLERKLRAQFRGYGANLLIAPSGGAQTLPLDVLSQAAKYGDAAPFLYSVQSVNGEPVVLAGTDFERAGPLTSFWKVDGRRRPLAGECLVGEGVAARFSLGPGSMVDVAGRRLRVAGVVSTGAAEDSQVILPLDDVAELARLGRVASVIAARVDGERVEQARAALAAALPGADVRLLRAVVESEAAVVLKVRSTLFLLTLLILLIVMLCVMNNFAAIVYQRRKEIGILKAIGGAESRVAALFASEAAAVALAGSLAGFALGSLLARWLGWQIFHQPVGTRPAVLPLVAAITLAVALAAIVVPLRRIRNIQPAVILRGE